MTREIQVTIRLSGEEHRFLSMWAGAMALPLASLIRMNAILRAREQFERAEAMTYADVAIEESRRAALPAEVEP
jgi:hypothetical protein